MVCQNNDIFSLFKLIVESSYDGIYVTDGKANTIFLNKSYEMITGILKKKVLGKNMKNLVKNGVFNQSGSLMAIEQKKEITINQTLKSGKSIFVTSTPVFDKDNNIIYVVTNVRDMRELERLEKQLIQVTELTKKYKKEIEKIKNSLYDTSFFTNNPKMEKIITLIKNVAKFDSSILLQGETGTGKTYFAKMIHELSSRNTNKFLEINCSAFPIDLVESELFGYEPGSFTGASTNGKKGIFELADNSTLFLDEISELSLETQAKLLKVIETGTFFKVGGNKPINTNVRIIAASNKNLEDLVKIGKFRKDLFYRLNVILIEIPPIRERKEDIIPFLLIFLNYYNQKYHLNKNLSKRVIDILLQYNWPGNIREIKNTVEHMLVVSKDKEIVDEDIPDNIKEYFKNELSANSLDLFCNCCLEMYSKLTLKKATVTFQKDIINLLLKKGINKSKIAKMLDVNPSTISRKFLK